MDRNKKVFEDFKKRNATSNQAGELCCWAGCQNKSFISCQVGCAVRTPEGKIEEFGVIKDAEGMPLSKLSFMMPFCHHHFMYPNEGLVFAEVSPDTKPGEEVKSIGLLAQWEMIRVMEVIAHQAYFANNIDKQESEKEQATKENIKS